MSERISAILARAALEMLSDDAVRILLAPHTTEATRERAEESIRAISPPAETPPWEPDVEARRLICAGLAGDAEGTRSMSRANVGAREDGWQQIGLPCVADRRSLWVRFSPGVIELCAGREGDDSYAVICEGERAYRSVLDVLEDAVWAATGA